MFRWIRRFTESPSSPPGLERILLKQLPAVLLLGSLAIALPSLLLRLFDQVQPGHLPDRLIQSTDFLAFGVWVVHVTALVTVAIGAFMVVVMKGPVHHADDYPLSDADRPRPGPGRSASDQGAEGRRD